VRVLAGKGQGGEEEIGRRYREDGEEADERRLREVERKCRS